MTDRVMSSSIPKTGDQAPLKPKIPHAGSEGGITF